jgi:lipopolysaccharide/colanic/teichoic acid biosynthesis glycosyltransferase
MAAKEARVTGNPNRMNRDLSIVQISHFEGAPGFYRQHLKRPIDLFFSIIALIACGPAILLAMALIALETGGSPIYKQLRIGKDGGKFFIYKIRTMYEGADKQGFKTDLSDPRVTRLGKFLRDNKIDELPQLINIIKGEMSLIGPRPLSVDESNYVVEELGFSKQHPGFIPRTLPGCTGLEQIYRIHSLIYTERFHWNHYYEDKLSAIVDLKIFYSTVLMCRFICYGAVFGAIVELAWFTYVMLHSK